MAVGAMSMRRWMGLAFALGASCFLVGPIPAYVSLVGGSADALTLFVGSILFTLGGALQSALAWPHRFRIGQGGPAAWWAAIIQSAGTLFFNATTYEALHVSVSSSSYNELVWRPDWRGSVCFLVSGLIAYLASKRTGWHRLLPARGGDGWWQPAVNWLGCVVFGVSALAAYASPAGGSMLSQVAANASTSLGAVCFLACAIDTLHTGKASKMPLVEEIWDLGHDLVEEIEGMEG